MGGDQEDIPLYTYYFLCKYDKAEMSLELSKELNYIPKCLKCNRDMLLRYSINNDGEIWMNSAIMHE